MIPFNLISLYNLERYYSDLNSNFMKHLNNLGHDTSIDELKDILVFIDCLKMYTSSYSIFDGYILGFVIERIGKEFDLLRFGKNKVINIEIKRQSSISKIEDQLAKNSYYLNLLKKDIELYTFISSNKKLYQYKNEVLKEVDFNILVKSILSQKLESKSNVFFDINNKFDTDKFIISPINNFDLFYRNKYFLTNEQQQIKKHILININNRPKLISVIQGQPGSGKTLLSYDISLSLSEKGIKNLIIHCGNLSQNHKYINSIQDKIYIVSVKDFFDNFLYFCNNYEVIIIDEAQRLRKDQLKLIEEKHKYLNSYFILSLFPYQRLSKNEFNNGIENLAYNKDYLLYNLKGKIRSNYNITHFIKCFFDKKSYLRSNKLVHNIKENVTVDFSMSRKESTEIIKTMSNDNWSFLIANSSNKFSDLVTYNSFDILGQEFKNVVIILDQTIAINDDNLEGSSDFSQYLQLIYQNMTRARDNLHIIVEDNPNLYSYIIDIIDYYS